MNGHQSYDRIVLECAHQTNRTLLLECGDLVFVAATITTFQCLNRTYVYIR